MKKSHGKRIHFKGLDLASNKSISGNWSFLKSIFTLISNANQTRLYIRKPSAASNMDLLCIETRMKRQKQK